MSYFIEVQTRDWDDYPVGKPTNIGTFISQTCAESFLERSSKFEKNGTDWHLVDVSGYHTVTIRSTGEIFSSPDYWL